MRSLYTFKILSVLFLLSSCQKITEEELKHEDLQTLKIKTRSAENTEIKYPLHLYAFDNQGYYVTSQIINNSEEEMQLSLAKGEYRIIALCGLSNDYSLTERPNLSDWIKLKSINGAKAPLMTGKADIDVNTQNTTLNITLSYVVTAISVSLKGLPTDVSSVRLTLSPMYPFLGFHGEYGGEPYKLEIPCLLDSENIWSANQIYAYPGSSTETILSVTIKKKDRSEETYAYTYSGVPQANHPFNISGYYTGNITIGGSFILKDWKEETNVEFSFGTTTSTDEETDQEDKDEQIPPPLHPDTPEVGDIWNNAIVVKTEGNNVLLLSLEEWYTTTSEIEDILQEKEAWHLPNYEEAILLRSTFNNEKRIALNKKIEEYNDTLWGLDGEERYLCNKGGILYSFIFEESTTISKAGNKRSYYMRLLKWDKTR